MAIDSQKYDGSYRGDDPAIKEALERITPISLGAADWSEDDGYGVIDGFIAVVDGREDLVGALEKARELIQKPEFEAVTVVRQSDTLKKTEDKISDLFWNAAFGNKSFVRPDKTVGIRPSKQGTVLLDPDHNNFIIKGPGQAAFGIVNLIREKLKIEIPEFTFQKAGFFNRGPGLGSDFKSVFGAAGQVFPEYMSVSVSNGQATSEPGLMHFDSGYRTQEINTHGSYENRSYKHLPQNFLKAANERKFVPLPGNVTITASFIGGGSIIRKTDPERYSEYKEHERNGALLENKAYFQDGDQTGYQAQDGDIMIMRNDEWPDDEHGNACLPSDHCSTILNAYGNHGNHLGRMVGLMSSQVCYMSPQVREHLGMSRMPEPHEYQIPKEDEGAELDEHLEEDTSKSHPVMG